MNAALKVAGVEKTFKRLMIDEKVAAIGTWDAVRAEIEDLTAFSVITVERGGIEIFGGRIERPGIDFSRRGSEIRPSGFDYTIKLTDYLTPQSSIADTATATALATLITNTPFTLNIIDTFSYIADPTIFDTTVEFLQFDFSDTCIVYDPNTPLEVDEESHDASTIQLPSNFFRATFFNGTYQFVFWEDGLGNIFYDARSLAGAWKGATDTLINTAVARQFAIAFNGTTVFLFVFDGANTDLYTTAIAGNVLTFALKLNNVVAGWIQWAACFDSEGDIWIVDNNIIYESTDGGATWNNRGNTGGLPILALFPDQVAGDIHAIVRDAGPNDLEDWLYDKSVPGFAFSLKIGNEVHTIDSAAGGVDGDWHINLIYQDNPAPGFNTELWYTEFTPGVGWSAPVMVENDTPAGTQPLDDLWHACCDGAGNTYLYWTNPGGQLMCDARIAGVWDKGNLFSAVGGDPNAPPHCPMAWMVDDNAGWYELGIHIWRSDAVLDGRFYLQAPLYMRLNAGQTTGWFRTNTITAGGSFVKWGYCAAVGVQFADTDWSVRLAADNSLLGTGGQQPTFDIDIATGGTTQTSIKILVEFTYVAVDPYVSEISVSEKIDEVTLELDFEDVYTGMKKWAALAGAEFWLDSSDVLHVALARGSDKSNRVFLKNSKTSDLPALEPNIKVVSRNPDWAPYANAIYVIGAAGPPRIEAEVKDQPSIDVYGEHWYCHRDPDIQTVAMAITVGSIELTRRNTVIDRIGVVILDEYDPKDIEIGDVVWVVAEFGDDVATKLNSAMRVVSLNRSWGTGGEQVSLELINLIAATEYWGHLVTISDLTRWVTA